MTGRPKPYDPRSSWVPALTVFALALVLVVDLARPGGVLGGGLWIPGLYAVVPAGLGVLAYVRARSGSGRRVRGPVVAGLTLWGVVGALAALVVLIVVSLGRPRPPVPSDPTLGLVTGLLTYLIPSAVFAVCFGVAGTRRRWPALALVLAAPVVTTGLFAAAAWLSY